MAGGITQIMLHMHLTPICACAFETAWPQFVILEAIDLEHQ